MKRFIIVANVLVGLVILYYGVTQFIFVSGMLNHPERYYSPTQIAGLPSYFDQLRAQQPSNILDVAVGLVFLVGAAVVAMGKRFAVYLLAFMSLACAVYSIYAPLTANYGGGEGALVAGPAILGGMFFAIVFMVLFTVDVRYIVRIRKQPLPVS